MGVICKYFQQGRCRFGNECKFQHSDVYDDGGGSNRGGRLGDQYHYYKQDKPDVNVILQGVQQEIITSEKGKQWPLSCFAPLKEYGTISGWEDISPEELRWQMYLSRQSGTLDKCIKEIQEVHQKAKINKNAMLNPTLESYSILESIFTKDASTFSFAPTETQTANSFTSGGTGVFGGSAVQTGFTGTLAAGHSSSIFGGSGAATPSVFGNIPAASPANVFGNVAPSSASVFGNVAPSSASVFGNVAPSSTTVFGNVAPSSASVFGNVAPTSANVFGNVAASSASVFGNVAPSSANVFGNVAASPANVFGNVAASTANVFGNAAAAPAGMFGAQAHSSSIFGNHQPQTVGNIPQNQSSPFQSSTTSVFGNTSAQNTSIAGDDAYTPLSQLAEDVLALFKADKFVMGKIPTLPPPRELCH